MGIGYRRNDLRAQADAKVADAMLLLHHRRFSNAYYLAGYAVELGLKACIAAQIAAETLPDKDLLKGLLTHEYPKLVGLAGLGQELKDKQDADEVFASNWAVASEWKPDSRYEMIDPTTAQQLLQAICDPKSGVLQWIRTHW